MAISTQNYEIIGVKVSRLMVKMMNYKSIDIIKTTPFAFNDMVSFETGSIAKCPVRFFRFQSAIDYIGTLSGTIPFRPRLECLTTRNNLTAELARFSLDTGKRTVISSFAQFIYSKYFPASRAYFVNVSINIPAFLGAVNLALSHSPIVSLKFFIANLTNIHTSIIAYIKGAYKEVQYSIT